MTLAGMILQKGLLSGTPFLTDRDVMIHDEVEQARRWPLCDDCGEPMVGAIYRKTCNPCEFPPFVDGETRRREFYQAWLDD